jgi:nitrite reductase (NADH) large subunit
MAKATRYVIVGNGVAGNRAAEILRERDPDSRITIVTSGTFLLYRRDDLYRVLDGHNDWREYLVHPPSFYEERRIDVRRQSKVVSVESEARKIVLTTGETVSYDTLLVATGGMRYTPQHLEDWAEELDFLDSYRQAIEARKTLPKGGKAIILGGDIKGLRLARELAQIGFEVALLPYDRTFWPHKVTPNESLRFLKAISGKGVSIVSGVNIEKDIIVERIERARRCKYAKRIHLSDGRTIEGDLILSYFGALPMVDFMFTAGVEIEHGIRVDQQLKTANAHIYAAGLAAQTKRLQPGETFFYTPETVRHMGEVAAINMTGGEAKFEPPPVAELTLDNKGELISPYL